jgi:hypothetical protein
MRQDNLLLSLTETGRRAAVLGDTGIDWDLPIAKPRWMSSRAYSTAISQLYYGELATIEMCERLTRCLDDAEACRFIATQIADERRHVGYYERYLARIGDIGAIEEGVEMAYQGALAWPGSYHGAIVAFHVILEGEGLRIQRLYGDWFPCPLFQQINALIARDEGRHVTFGRHFLKESLDDLSFDERLAIFRWIKALWFDCAAAIRAEMPRAASLLVGRAWAENRWQRQQQTLLNIGLVQRNEIDAFDRT